MSIKPSIVGQTQLTPYYARYRRLLCEARQGLDGALRAGAVRAIDGVQELVERYEIFLLDAFGVLNRGTEAIAGAVETVERLLACGKVVRVVSNNASQSPERIAGKLMKMGFPLGVQQLVTSGMVVRPWIQASEWREQPYYMVGTAESGTAYGPAPERLMVNHPDAGRTLDEACYLLLCSNREYYGGEQERAAAALLKDGQRPVVVANPDLVAPDDRDRIYAVAGYTAGEWLDRHQVRMVELGKPFAPVFELALQGLPSVRAGRILMVGDTLDTDILGGKAMGFDTCLTLSGIYQGEEETLPDLMAQRGIRPDYLIPSLRW